MAIILQIRPTTFATSIVRSSVVFIIAIIVVVLLRSKIIIGMVSLDRKIVARRGILLANFSSDISI